MMSLSKVLGESFNISDYMSKVRSLPDVSSSDAAFVDRAFQDQMQRVMSAGQGAMMIKWDWSQLKKFMNQLTESGLKKTFALATGHAARLSTTKTKLFLQQGMGYHKRAPSIQSPFIRARLKRDTTGMSIYKLVGKHLNYDFDVEKARFIGFVGEDMGTPLTGSRGAALAPLVEGLKSGGSPRAPMFPVAPSVNWTPNSAEWTESAAGNDLDNLFQIAIDSNNKNKMNPVRRVKPLPFLQQWSVNTTSLTMDKFMELMLR